MKHTLPKSSTAEFQKTWNEPHALGRQSRNNMHVPITQDSAPIHLFIMITSGTATRATDLLLHNVSAA